jgi:hypothetical protein
MRWRGKEKRKRRKKRGKKMIFESRSKSPGKTTGGVYFKRRPFMYKKIDDGIYMIVDGVQSYDGS